MITATTVTLDYAILAVHGHPVKKMDELFTQLQASNPIGVKIQLRRNQCEQVS